MALLCTGLAAPAQAQTDFGACDSRTWLKGLGANGHPILARPEQPSSSLPLVYAGEAGKPAAMHAAAFNPQDYFVYGVAKGSGSAAREESANGWRLLRVANDGTVTVRAQLQQIPAQLVLTNGTFDSRGFYYLGAQSAPAIYRVNIETGAVSEIPLAEPLSLQGLAWHGGRLYGAGLDGRLYVIGTASQIAGETSTAGVAPLPEPAAVTPLRSLFAAANGIFGNAADGTIYHYDLQSGQPTAVGHWQEASGHAVRCPEATFETFAAALQRSHLSTSPRATRSSDQRRSARIADIYMRLQEAPRRFIRGGDHRLQLVVGNASETSVENVRVRVPVPEGVNAMRWVCVGDGSAICREDLGSGAVDILVDLHSEVTLTLIQAISTSAGNSITTTAEAILPPNTVDPDLSNNTVSHTSAVALGQSFGSCDSRVFLHQNANTTDLTLVDSATNPFSFTFVGNSTNVEYNAAGYNPADNFIYAISSDNSLIQVSADGTSEVVRINILPDADWVAGTFASDGFLYVSTGNATQNVFRIDVTLQNPFVVQSLTFDVGDVTSPGDWAFYNGLMYTVDTTNNQLKSFDPVGQPNGAVVPVTEIGTASVTGTVIAMWGASNGIFGATDAGIYYQFDPDTGEATQLSTGNASSVMDGSHCIDAPFLLPPQVTIEKVSFDGVGNFNFSTSNLNGSPGITTTEEGVPVQAGPLSVINPGQPITISEPSLPQSFVLTDISCTGLSEGGTATVDLNARSVTIDGAGTQAGADIVCTFTNTFEQTTVTIEKVSFGGVGTFGFSVQNAGGSPNITTVEEGVPVQAPPNVVVNAGQQVVISEPTLPDGFTLTNISCTGFSEGGSTTVDLNARSVTIDGAGTQLGADIVCTFTNAADVQATDLAVSKSATPDPVTSGDTVTYTITVDNLGPLDTTNAVLTDTPDASQDCITPASVTCSASNGAQCPVDPISISALLGSGVVIPSLPANSQLVFTVQCTVTATGL